MEDQGSSNNEMVNTEDSLAVLIMEEINCKFTEKIIEK
jgi:hypothetical protein